MYSNKDQEALTQASFQWNPRVLDFKLRKSLQALVQVYFKKHL